MACNNGLFGGNCFTWIIILLVLMNCCGDNVNAISGNGCGCGCQNNCGC